MPQFSLLLMTEAHFHHFLDVSYASVMSSQVTDTLIIVSGHVSWVPARPWLLTQNSMSFFSNICFGPFIFFLSLPPCWYPLLPNVVPFTWFFCHLLPALRGIVVLVHLRCAKLWLVFLGAFPALQHGILLVPCGLHSGSVNKSAQFGNWNVHLFMHFVMNLSRLCIASHTDCCLVVEVTEQSTILHWMADLWKNGI